ncbi:ABC transporter permease [Miniphocaeibacter massiliensis]|uniref:ABC transporter permease n=1 Tax=Miniphocaeibacter massiliensis TaxID=2041841 RepID=UPI000C1C0D1C|nr:iron ABC transporter permease [Miniphocaeibacter massiliensis]
MNKKKKSIKFLDKTLIAFISIIVVLFILYPFIAVFKESLFEDGIFNISKFFDFLITEKKLISNSLLMAFLTAILTTSVTIAISIYWLITSSKFKKLINYVLFLTLVSPPFITSLSYINLFGKRGFITYELLGLRLNPYGLNGIVFMQSVGFISLNALILIGILKNIDSSTINSARSLGAKTNNIIVDIILPYLKSGIIVVFMLTFIRSLSDFSTPAIIGGSYNVLATEAYLSIISMGDINRSALVNLVLFLIAIIIFLIFRNNFKQISMKSEVNNNLKIDINKQGLIFNAFKILSFFFLIMLIIQYSSIFLSAFTKSRGGNLYFTFENVLNSKQYFSSTYTRSIVYSLIAGIVSSFLGLFIVYYLQIRKIKFFKFIDFIATLPYIVPGTFFGIGYILAFNKAPLKLTGTVYIVVLNLIFKLLPFATKTNMTSISQINRELINSTKDLGAYSLYDFKDVVYPLSKESLFLTFVNGFTSSMTTIGSIIFLIYPSQKVITLVLFDVVQSGKYGVASVLSCLIIITCLIVNALYHKLISKRSSYVFKN